MNGLKRTILGSAILGTLTILTAQSAAAQTSYVMSCRSGGNMQATAGVRGEDPYVFAQIRYMRGSAGAAVIPPSPGECTWIDRGVGTGEPSTILFVDTSTAAVSTFCKAGDCRVSTSSLGVQKLMNFVKNQQAFQVHVYNNGSGQMIVTKIRP